MSFLYTYDNIYYNEKFNKIKYENKLLFKKNKQYLNNLIEIKKKQAEALEQIFDYLNNLTLNNKLSTSELQEIRYDELVILKELENLNKFI
jgi:hypothetical protein